LFHPEQHRQNCALLPPESASKKLEAETGGVKTGDVMEKKMIIRGVAVLFAGISTSIIAVHQLSGNATSHAGGDLAQVQMPPSQVLGASLVGGGAKLQFTNTADAPDMADLSDEVAPTSMIEPDSPEFSSLGFDAEEYTTSAPLPELEIIAQQGGACPPVLHTAAMVDALIEVTLDAPCHPDTRLVISHNDLAFSAFTDADGRYTAFIPALSADAKIDVFLSDDIFLQSSVEIPDAEDHQRVALQWDGTAQFALHAYHNGAAYGENGHIHAQKPFDPNLDDSFLISLGELRGPEPMIAEIYSVPTARAAQSRVEVELQYTEHQCAQDFSAFLSDNSQVQNTHMKEISIAVPNCPAEAGLVVMPLDFASRHAFRLQTLSEMLGAMQE